MIKRYETGIKKGYPDAARRCKNPRPACLGIHPFSHDNIIISCSPCHVYKPYHFQLLSANLYPVSFINCTSLYYAVSNTCNMIHGLFRANIPRPDSRPPVPTVNRSQNGG